MPKINAIIILYNPDSELFILNLKATILQVQTVFIVDNSSFSLNESIWDNFSQAELARLDYTFNGNNLGVASAQNIGLKKAILDEADYVIIFDQDSCPSENMVEQLSLDLKFLLIKHHNIGAIGPLPINVQTHSPYSPRVKKLKPFVDAQHILQVSELISSGCLISKDALEKVGLMDEKLFIDGVDHEWCWRASTHGYQCALSTTARLYHMLGEGDRKLLGLRIAITSPFRVYYQYRNYIYLVAKRYVPVYWKVNNAVKYAIKFFYYTTMISPRQQYFKNILRGIKDGITRNFTHK